MGVQGNGSACGTLRSVLSVAFLMAGFVVRVNLPCVLAIECQSGRNEASGDEMSNGREGLHVERNGVRDSNERLENCQERLWSL